MSQAAPSKSRRRRLAIVSALANRPQGPRAVRTRALAEAFGAGWDVELIAQPFHPAPQGAAVPARASRLRRLGGRGVQALLLDRWEPWSRRELGRWTPGVDAALLIGFPFSPLVVASGRLAQAGIPYVVDSGDPWWLTGGATGLRMPGPRRAVAGERRLWEGASGAVLTTRQQADKVAELVPGLPTLVRPNGYIPYPDAPGPSERAPDPAHLRLVHFGKLEVGRVDLGAFLATLRATGPWQRITFAQYGDDFSEMLDAPPAGVDVERRAALPWEECIAASRQYDLAVVVGNVRPTQLPSKTVEYLTLPVPRLALTSPAPDDTITQYVSGRPGWIAVTAGEPDAGERVAEHVARRWTAEELAPPPEEAWPAVAREVVEFFERCLPG
jgi:hypothetical protein